MEPTPAWVLILVAGIAAVPGTLGAIFAGFTLWRSSQNGKSLVVVEKKVNGMSSELVAATRAAASAEGQLQERDAERVHLEGKEV